VQRRVNAGAKGFGAGARGGGGWDSPNSIEHYRAKVLEQTAESRRWRDATPTERIEIEIEKLQDGLGMLRAYGFDEVVRARMERILTLQAELKELNVARSGARETFRS
jgi:hypothetical protein